MANESTKFTPLCQYHNYIVTTSTLFMRYIGTPSGEDCMGRCLPVGLEHPAVCLDEPGSGPSHAHPVPAVPRRPSISIPPTALVALSGAPAALSAV